MNSFRDVWIPVVVPLSVLFLIFVIIALVRRDRD